MTNPKNTKVPDKKIKKLIAVIFGCLVLCAAAAGVIAYDLYTYATSPVSHHEKEVSITIQPGDSFGIMVQQLVSHGLVTSPDRFRIIARITGDDTRIKAGEYGLSTTMSPYAMLQKMVSGSVKLHKFTVPEGYTIYQIADLSEKTGFVTREAFLETATSVSAIKKLGLPDQCQSFEGYLFPETYYFPKASNALDIITAMVKRFHVVFQPQWQHQATTLGLTVHEVVTLASIIEKETGVDYERPLIASVFHNRLEKGMRLETDPTVIYGIKNFDGNITKKHLQTKTPYNTYKISGLPPGPIASPGAASIKAALYPAKTDYLFFVSKKDATHKFSTNLRDHINAVNKYQLRRH